MPDNGPAPAQPTAGTIYLAATPIGNDGDASPRLRELLAGADCVAAEDTRRLGLLCARLGISRGGDLLPLHDHNEADQAPELIRRARAGQTILVVSDAGTPTVSDPGFRLAQAAIAADVPIRPLPGPSAALAALSVSGLPSDRFAFEGFLPRKSGELHRQLSAAATDPRTLIFFESPRRLGATLVAMADEMGAARPAAVCRELTKTHEEVVRGTLAELAARFSGEVRGEITVVVGGCPPAAHSPADYADEVRRLAAGGLRLKDAAAEVARQSGLRKNDLYRAALEQEQD